MTDLPDYHAVLVYDGDCPFCSAASSALRRLDGVGTVPWADEAAQSFLDAQFGDVPFALIFADSREGTVYVGREAAHELCERAGLPVLIRDLVGDNYESLADAVRTVAGARDEADVYHETLPLSPGALDRYPTLAASAESTHRPDVSGRRRR